MNTITGCFIVLNEVENIEYSLTNPLKILDHIIIIDGGSTDGTERKIIEIANKYNMRHKITIYVKPFVDLNTQRNEYLKYCKTSHLMYIDADEVYTEEDLKKIKEIYINYYDCIQIRSYHFYIDFYHIAIGGSWDTSFMMPKCFRNYPDKMHYFPYEPMRGDHELYINNIYFMEFFKKRKTFPLEDIACYHISHALGREHQKKKILWWLKYDHPEISIEKHEKIANNDGYFDRRFWEEGINADPKGIIKFTGTHPNILKTHPYYNIKVIKD